MKTTILTLGLIFSSLAFAGKDTSVWPNVYNFGNHVQVQVWNHTDKEVRCSGFVYMDMESGERTSEHYFDWVRARGSSFRNVYPRIFNDRIRSVNHSIWCN